MAIIWILKWYVNLQSDHKLINHTDAKIHFYNTANVDKGASERMDTCADATVQKQCLRSAEAFWLL